MGYQVLARKYRPKNFSELVGQEHVARALGNALTQIVCTMRIYLLEQEV